MYIYIYVVLILLLRALCNCASPAGCLRPTGAQGDPELRDGPQRRVCHRLRRAQPLRRLQRLLHPSLPRLRARPLLLLQGALRAELQGERLRGLQHGARRRRGDRILRHGRRREVPFLVFLDNTGVGRGGRGGAGSGALGGAGRLVVLAWPAAGGAEMGGEELCRVQGPPRCSIRDGERQSCSWYFVRGRGVFVRARYPAGRRRTNSWTAPIYISLQNIHPPARWSLVTKTRKRGSRLCAVAVAGGWLVCRCVWPLFFLFFSYKILN